MTLVVQQINLETGEESIDKIGVEALESGIADAHFIHNQTVASDEWYFSHPLGKTPVVFTENSAGDPIIGVPFPNNSTVTIKFNHANSGRAICN